MADVGFIGYFDNNNGFLFKLATVKLLAKPDQYYMNEAFKMAGFVRCC